MALLKVKSTDTGIKLSGLVVFDLHAIFDCGQCFRWFKRNNKYIGVVNNKVLEVYKKEDEIFIDNITVDEYLDYYQDYFDINTNYIKIYNTLRQDPTFADNTPKTSGLRILNQELFETLISFIISSNNNIPRIKANVDNVCSLYGNKIEYKGMEFYTFPTYEQLSRCTLKELRYIGLGYRAEYIIETLKLVKVLDINHNGWSKYIKSLNYNNAKRVLMNFKGVGDKVADCVCLFSLGHSEAFPIDTWIKKILFRLYGIRVYDRARLDDFVETRFGKNAGYAQQYLYYYKRNKL